MRAWMLLALTANLFLALPSFAASVTGVATQTVVASLKLQRISDLNFGQAEQNSPPKTIPPGTGDNPDNASFQVTGEPFRSYQIQLPGDLDVVMSTQGGGTPEKEIRVFNFQSYPSHVGSLNQSGSQLLLVGAGRPAIKPNQVPGLYEGTFMVSVVY